MAPPAGPNAGPSTALDAEQLAQANLPLPPRTRLRLRWGYGPERTILFACGWLAAGVLPFSVLLPLGLFTSKFRIVNVGIAIATCLGLPLLNLLCVSQARAAAQFFDIHERRRFRKLEEIIHALLFSHSQTERANLRSAAQRIIRDHQHAQKIAMASRMHIVRLLCRSRYGRLLCWTGDAIVWSLFAAILIIPLLVFLPLGFSGPELDLSFEIGARDWAAVCWTAAVLSVLTWTTPKLSRCVQRRRKRPRAQPSTKAEKRERRRRLGLPENVTLPSFIRSDQDSSIASSEIFDREGQANPLIALWRVVPSWLPRQIVGAWAFVITPVLLAASATAWGRMHWVTPTLVDDVTVKRHLRSWGYILVSLFVVLSLLTWTLSRRSSLILTETELNVFVQEELKYMQLCVAKDWHLSQLGDYPHFSIGEGVVTKGLLYHSQSGHSILLRRLYLVVSLLVFLPVVLLLSLSQQFDDERKLALKVLLSCSVPLAILFVSGKLVWGVLPRRRKTSLPWVVVWVASCLVAPVVVGSMLQVYYTRAEWVGKLVLGWSTPSFLTSALAWLISERGGLFQWLRTLTIHKPWLLEICSMVWRTSLPTFIISDVLLMVSASIDADSASGLMVAFALLSNLSLFGFSFGASVAGVIRIYEGMTRGIVFLALLVRWNVFLLAWLELATAQLDGSSTPAGFLVLVKHSDTVRYVTFGVVVLSEVLLAVYLISLYKDYLTKKKFGYFPANWELYQRPVVEEAAKVVTYPTETIEGELRRRELIDPSVRALTAIYLDPGLSEDDRMNAKGRLVQCCTTPVLSREELETMLENAIAKDVQVIEELNRALRTDHLAKLRVGQDKSAIIKIKFEAFKASQLIDWLESRLAGPGNNGQDLEAGLAGPSAQAHRKGLPHRLTSKAQRLVQQDRAALQGDINKRRGNQAGRAHNGRSLSEAKKPEAQASGKARPNGKTRKGRKRAQPDASASADKGNGAPRPLATRYKLAKAPRVKDQPGGQKCQLVDVVQHFRYHPRLRAFNVAMLNGWSDLTRLPRPRLFSVEREPAYSRVNHLVILDGVNDAVLFVGYHTWEVVEVSFALIHEMFWKPLASKRQDSVKVELVTGRPGADSQCNCQLGRGLERYHMYFASPEERQEFCMLFYEFACVVGRGTRSRPRFAFDGDSHISQRL